MADLSKLNETKGFIAAWRAEGMCGYKMINMAAQNQRENLRSIELTRLSSGRIPTWCNIEEYTQCVELLEAASKRHD